MKNKLSGIVLKENGIKIIAIIIIIAVICLSLDVFTQTKDGRKQIIDDNGGIESELCSILSDIEGVGDVSVMLQYDDAAQVKGAIVTAEGAENTVVKNNITKAVMAVFNISATDVEVFKKTPLNNEEEGIYEK